LIEVYLRAALGPAGWEILEFLREYQLVVYATVVGGYVAFRLFRWRFDPRERTSEGGDAGGMSPYLRFGSLRVLHLRSGHVRRASRRTRRPTNRRRTGDPRG
jgi:hypothetical protein